jgi:hypothetical protein
MRRAAFALIVAASALSQPAAVVAQERCDNCGRVESIRTVTTREIWVPLGSTAGPSLAGDAGQPGRVTSMYNFSSGNTVLLGAAGGAGYAKRPSAYERPRWEIAVKMDGGGVRKVSNDYEPALREGDRVRVYGTQLDLITER